MLAPAALAERICYAEKCAERIFPHNKYVPCAAEPCEHRQERSPPSISSWLSVPCHPSLRSAILPWGTQGW